MVIDWAEKRAGDKRDGVVDIPGLLDPDQRDCTRRRRLTLRFFGERTHDDPKAAKSLPNFPDMATKLRPGDPMRAPGVLRLHPKAAATAA